jgi:hypothetical protein
LKAFFRKLDWLPGAVVKTYFGFLVTVFMLAILFMTWIVIREGIGGLQPDFSKVPWMELLVAAGFVSVTATIRSVGASIVDAIRTSSVPAEAVAAAVVTSIRASSKRTAAPEHAYPMADGPVVTNGR